MYVWTGFDWLTIKKAELEKWSGTLTIIEVYEASGLTEAQRAEVMNQTDDIISGNSTVYLGDGRISYGYHVEIMRD